MTQKASRFKLPTALTIAAILLLWLGYQWGWQAARTAPAASGATAAGAAVWTCSMHPSVRQPSQGLCPLCGMDLVTASEGSAGTVVLNEAARQRAMLPLVRVERRTLAARIDAVGKLRYDERTSRRISALLNAEVRDLFIPYAGTRVQAGDPLISLFSGELLTGQRQYLEAVEALGGRPLDVRSAASLRFLAAREKLLGWGMTESEIATLQERHQPRAVHPITAPFNGLITAVHVKPGTVVPMGAPLFDLADDSALMLDLAVHEDEVPLITYGQPVTFEASAYPGQTFEAKVVFIDTTLDPVQRTVRVRARVDNAGFRLQDEMLVRAALDVAVTDADANVSSRWRCPEHPQQTSFRAGSCARCDLPLAPSNRFYNRDDTPVLAIPASAPLITGRRALVFVTSTPDSGEYQAREVVLGRRAGDWFPIRSGLNEGEWIVRSGAFKLDSELQFQGEAGMMGGVADGSRQRLPDELAEVFDRILDRYLALQAALSQDKDGAAEAAALNAAISAIADRAANAGAPDAWLDHQPRLTETARAIAAAETVAARRQAFSPFSQALAAAVGDIAVERTLYRVHCPMAFDNKGADWLQTKRAVENPYFGSAMFACGAVTEDIPGEDR